MALATALASMEALEARRMMSVSLADGVLTITGTDERERVEFNADASEFVWLSVQSQYHPEGWFLGNVRCFPRTDVKSIRIDLGGGDDVVVMASTPNHQGEFDQVFDIPMFIDGGAGNDTLAGGRGADTIIGGAGDDWIAGDSSSDRLGLDIGGATDRDVEFQNRDYPLPPTFSGAVVRDNGQGDSLYADGIPAPTPTPVDVGPAAVETPVVAAPAPTAFAAGPVIVNSLLKGDADEVWGGHA